jgi:hypothetical protein
MNEKEGREKRKAALYKTFTANIFSFIYLDGHYFMRVLVWTS